MNGALRGIFAIMAATVVALVVWIATPSSIFLQPISMVLDGKVLTFVRATPFGDVTVRRRAEITMVDRGSVECSNTGDFLVAAVPGDTVVRQMGTWAWPCINMGPPFILRYQFTVMLGGIIPLRAVNFAIPVNPANIKEVAP